MTRARSGSSAAAGGRRAHLPALQANPDAVIAGIADPDPRTGRAHGRALRHSAGARVPRRRRDAGQGADLDAAIVAVPHDGPCADGSRCAGARAASPAREADDHPAAGRGACGAGRAGKARRSDHRLSVALQSPGARRARCHCRRADRHHRVRLLPVCLDRARTLPRQPRALSRCARLFGQSAGP